MSEHKMKEFREKAEKELRAKVKQRLIADDVTFRDFSAIDGADLTRIPSTNDVTVSIWNDIIMFIEEYCMGFYNRQNSEGFRIVGQVLDEIGDEIADTMESLPVPYDDRYVSEIMADEHVTFYTARTYKTALNTGITCNIAMSVKYLIEASKSGTYMVLDGGDAKRFNPVAFNIKKLFEKRIGNIKVKDLVK